MTYFEAVLLGLVQGIFMFVPVSSTAHLVITQHILIRQGSALPLPDSPEMILFNLAVHVGTLVSITIVFRSTLRQLAVAGSRDIGAFARSRSTPGPWLKLLLLGLLTVAVTGAIGLIFKESFERVFAAPRLIAITLAITGVLLWLTDRLGPRSMPLKGIGVRVAVIIGVAQALALIPGLSRTGMTIVAGLFAGLKRRWAAEYSFLVAVPTILAATLVQAVQVASGAGLGEVGWGPLAVAFVVSAASGVLALKLVLALLYRAQLKVFSLYLFGFAALVALGTFEGIL